MLSDVGCGQIQNAVSCGRAGSELISCPLADKEMKG